MGDSTFLVEDFLPVKDSIPPVEDSIPPVEDSIPPVEESILVEEASSPSFKQVGLTRNAVEAE